MNGSTEGPTWVCHCVALSDRQWLLYRIFDLKTQIAAEETVGRNSGLLHAAQRMVKHLERQMDISEMDQ